MCLCHGAIACPTLKHLYFACFTNLIFYFFGCPSFVVDLGTDPCFFKSQKLKYIYCWKNFTLKKNAIYFIFFLGHFGLPGSGSGSAFPTELGSVSCPDQASSAGIFKKSMGARNRVEIGLSYQHSRLHSLADLVPWNRFLGSINVYNFGLRSARLHGFLVESACTEVRRGERLRSGAWAWAQTAWLFVTIRPRHHTSTQKNPYTCKKRLSIFPSPPTVLGCH